MISNHPTSMCNSSKDVTTALNRLYILIGKIHLKVVIYAELKKFTRKTFT